MTHTTVRLATAFVPQVEQAHSGKSLESFAFARLQELRLLAAWSAAKVRKAHRPRERKRHPQRTAYQGGPTR
jgi:hypothetical protein